MNCCHTVTMKLPSHCHNAVAITLSQWSCHQTIRRKLPSQSKWSCHHTVIRKLPPHCHNEGNHHTITRKLQSHCHKEIAITLSQWNCHHTITMKLLSHWSCHHTFIMQLLSRYNDKDAVTLFTKMKCWRM